MKKIVCLLAMLCLGGIGFAQTYDYDRIPPEPAGAPRPWATVALDEQVVSLPGGTPYHRFSLMGNDNPTDIGDMTIKFTQLDEGSFPVKITPVLKDDADVEFRANHPVQFFVERDDREIIVSIPGGIKEYTTFCMIKMVWTDPQGEVHKKHIAMAF